MKAFKMFLVATLCIITQSFACAENKEDKISLAIEQILSSDNLENTWNHWEFLEKEISETILALQKESVEIRENFEDYIFRNVTSNKELTNAILSMLSLKTDLNVWQKRLVEKFLIRCEKNRSFLSSENKEKLKKVKDLYLKNSQSSYLLLKGKSTEVRDLEDFTMINYNYFIMKNSKDGQKFLTQEILNKNPDVICLEGVFSNEDAEFLYSVFQNNYAYFYADIESNNPNLNTGLFIASKFDIVHPGMHFCQDVPYFDFFITGDKALVHFYILDLQFTAEKSFFKGLLDRLNEENEKSPLLGIVCGNMGEPFKSPENLEFETSSFALLLNNQIAKDVLLINEKFLLNKDEGIYSSFLQWRVTLQEGHYAKQVFSGGDLIATYRCPTVAYCDNSSDKKGRSKVSVDVGVEKDEAGNNKASAKGKYEYTRESEKGARCKFSGEVEGSVNDKGKASCEARLKAEIDYKK